jgi:choline dehydrogenase
MACPRGKVIGGSSSINGMIYVRGHAHDYDTWAEMGADGWAYADVLPYFRRMEHWHGPEADASWRGTDGPLHITRGEQKNPLFQAFVESGAAAGYGVTADYNGERQEGFGAFDRTIWQGRRWSAADAYLRPAMAGGKLHRPARAGRPDRDHGGKGQGRAPVRWPSGHRTGRDRPRRRCDQFAENPHVEWNWPRQTPGRKRDSRHRGPPGVGQNLQDHLEMYIQFAAKEPVSLAPYWSLWGKALVGAQWVLSRTGLGASNQFEACGFIRSRAGLAYPDIQFHFLPIAVRYDGSTVAEGHGFQAHVGPMRSPAGGAWRCAGRTPPRRPRSCSTT